MTQYIYGIQAALVLCDDRGEYEVRDAIKFSERNTAIDVDRVIDAITARATECTGLIERPVY